MELESKIIAFLKKLNLCYLKIEDEKSLNKIYNLLIGEILFEPQTTMEFHYLGFYYQYIDYY